MAEIQLAPPEPPPAMAQAVERVLQTHGHLTEPALQQLTTELDRWGTDLNGLFWAFLGLESALHQLSQRGQDDDRQVLADWCQTQLRRFPELTDALLSIGEPQRRNAQENLARALGTPTSRTAPVVGAKAPTGSTKLSDLAPPNALNLLRPTRKRP
ncbi:MAG: hypothetical protein IPG45_26405 [Deltaproteobacteria bacterium]|jgi:hypothetical protein|nr:hypothetical protein [Deltaproteobacteria bacterium]